MLTKHKTEVSELLISISMNDSLSVFDMFCCY